MTINDMVYLVPGIAIPRSCSHCAEFLIQLSASLFCRGPVIIQMMPCNGIYYY